MTKMFNNQEVEFIWANDHQNREAILTWTFIPAAIPRIGERIWLDNAKDVYLGDGSTGSFDMAIVAEVEWNIDPQSCRVTIALRDPMPDEWANGRWKLYPEYEYASDGSYVIKESTGDMRIHKDSQDEEVITAGSLGVSELHS